MSPGSGLSTSRDISGADAGPGFDALDIRDGQQLATLKGGEGHALRHGQAVPQRSMGSSLLKV
jgi:hypothetical protein